MPKGPQGQKRPADVIGNAVRVMQIATGEVKDLAGSEPVKNAAAAELGRMGGNARAKKLSKNRRSQIAKNAAKYRWK